MTILKTFLRELELEAITTRKMLSCVPNDRYDWKPHPKSMSIRQLSTHIAELPAWIGMALTTDELDFAANPYIAEKVDSTEELLNYFERMLEDGRKHLKEGDENTLEKMWTLRNGDTIYSTETKHEVLRMSFSQIIHHRAQLGVYLRLLNVRIPGSYGPSADEMEEWTAGSSQAVEMSL
jgi:uncharacterized damage-inducible protein DinB